MVAEGMRRAMAVMQAKSQAICGLNAFRLSLTIFELSGDR